MLNSSVIGVIWLLPTILTPQVFMVAVQYFLPDSVGQQLVSMLITLLAVIIVATAVTLAAWNFHVDWFEQTTLPMEDEHAISELQLLNARRQHRQAIRDQYRLKNHYARLVTSGRTLSEPESL